MRRATGLVYGRNVSCAMSSHAGKAWWQEAAVVGFRHRMEGIIDKLRAGEASKNSQGCDFVQFERGRPLKSMRVE